jgi:hypothetical protein
VIRKKTYAGHILVLAAVTLISCQRAQEPAQSTGTGAPASSTQALDQHEVEVPASTVLWIQLQKDLDSSKLKTGDHFTGTLAEEVILNGSPVIPKGTSFKGRVTNSQTAQEKGTAGLLSLVLDSFTIRGTTYNTTTNPVTVQSATLEQDVPKDTKIGADASNAFVPKKGILQFFLANPVRVKT